MSLKRSPVHKTIVVPVAGTPVQVSATPVETPTILFQSKFNNTARVVIGNSSVVATPGGSLAGVTLANGGDGITISADVFGLGGSVLPLDLSDWFVDAAVNGETVQITFLKAE